MGGDWFFLIKFRYFIVKGFIVRVSRYLQIFRVDVQFDEVRCWVRLIIVRLFRIVLFIYIYVSWIGLRRFGLEQFLKVNFYFRFYFFRNLMMLSSIQVDRLGIKFGVIKRVQYFEVENLDLEYCFFIFLSLIFRVRMGERR